MPGPGILDRLFPYDPAYAGLLSVDRVQAMQKMAMARAGMGVMAAGAEGGPLTGAIGRGAGPEVTNWPQQLEGAASSAARITQFQQGQELRTKRQQIISQNPRQPGESEEDWLKRLYPLFLQIGDHEVLTNLTELLKGAGRGKINYSNYSGTNPDTGKPGTFRIPEVPGAPAELIPGVLPPKPGGVGRGGMKQVPGPNGPEWAIMNPDTGQFESTGQPAVLTEAQMRANALQQLTEDASKYLQGQMAPNRVQALTAAKGLNEFLKSSSEELEQASSVIADAYVRVTSGAAAREEEYQRARKMITPYPGDDATTLARKSRAVERLMRALRQASGRTAPPKEKPSGDPLCAHDPTLPGC